LWAGPYTTYKGVATGNRPIDPWKQEYRMFWSKTVSTPPLIPAGATGTMVIVSGGADKTIDATLGVGFDPDNIDDDIYYNFNAGIQ